MRRRPIVLGILIMIGVFYSASGIACDEALPATGVRDDVLIIVNDNSVDSCEVGRYYAEKRNLGRNNILHVRVPASFFVTWSEFKSLRDQILREMQRRVLAESPALTAASCSGTESSYYCDAVVTQVRDHTRIRYLVTTKGVPSRMPVDGSTLGYEKETVVDNYLKYWLLNYFTADVAFGSSSQARAKAFDDGRGMRIVEPSLDRELIIGRLDGITRDAAKAVIDRTLAAEANGIYGKVYSYTSHASNGTTGMVWKNYNGNNVYPGGTDPWRYQFGVFNETAPECNDYGDSSHYLQFLPDSNDGKGKTPSQCIVKISVPHGADELPPGYSASRQPLVEDALFYMGHLDGQATGSGLFASFVKWRRNGSCSNTLCENLPITEQAACRAASIDVYREIDTRCVGVADGFMGYNLQSYPVSFFNVAPTGWITGTASTFRFAVSEVRTGIGADDNHSLWYRNAEEVTQPLCYSGYDFDGTPSVPCNALQVFQVEKSSIDGGSLQRSDAAAPDQYRLRFKYKAEELSNLVTIQAWLGVTEAPSKKNVVYWNAKRDAAAVAAGTVTGWTQAEVVLTVDRSNTNHSADWDGTYQNFRFYLGSSTTYSGAIGLDDFSLAKVTATGDVAINISNPTFTDGHKQTTTGDHAANYLSRLNGVAFWGSMSHHESGGYSFSRHPLESMIYFMRGLPLGDAAWFAEGHNSGVFYGDPLYSPVAVKLDYLTPSSAKPFVYAPSSLALSGDAVNGHDDTRVSTSYAISYCSGLDFYSCDLQNVWQSTGLSGLGGQRAISFGAWDTSTLTPGAYTIRLAVTSVNALLNRSQTYNDYQTLYVFNDTSDYDNDGLTDADELAAGSVTSPLNPDMDNDGLLDGAELNIYHTSPIDMDSDDDRIFDKVEVDNGLNPLANDISMDNDGDGVINGLEVANNTAPNDASSVPPLKTVYVDAANASGTQDGSAQHPFTSLSAALAATIHGDTVRVAAGTYELSSPSGRYGLRIIGASSQQTIINIRAPWISNWYSGEIAHLRINATFNAGAALNIQYSQNIWVHDVDLRSDGNGISISSSQNIEIERCLAVASSSNGNGAGLYYTQISNAGGGRTRINNCTFSKFKYGIHGTQSDYREPSRLDISDTIFDTDVDLRTTLVNERFSANVRYSLLRNGTYEGLNGNLAGDAQFVSATNGDYHLLSTSPAVATGDPASDFSAEPQPNGARADMGVYGGTSDATTVTDLDGDRLPDNYERHFGLAVGADNGNLDADDDGFTDYIEYWQGSVPNNAGSTPLYEYRVLNPLLTSAQVVSLADNNVIRGGGAVLHLQNGESGRLDGLMQGDSVLGDAPFSLGSDIAATDSAVPTHFLGTQFVVPSYGSHHRFFLLSPYGQTAVTAKNGSTVINRDLRKDQIETVEIDDAILSTVIHSDRPILVFHAGHDGVQIDRYTYPVPPAVNELWGVNSTLALLSAVEDDTTVNVYNSYGDSKTYTINSGQKADLYIGVRRSHGMGDALHIVADKPVMALQTNDFDGAEQTAFLGAPWLTMQVALPVAAQYVAIVCPEGTHVKLKDAVTGEIEEADCAGQGNYPGKTYFGSGASGARINARSMISSNAPIQLYYEASVTNDEQNLFGRFSNVDVVMSVPDINLRAVISETLGKQATAAITRRDMLRLTTLDARSRHIYDLTGLEHALNLTRLELGDSGDPIAGYNRISDLSPLGGLTKLTYLDLSNNLITDIGVLGLLTQLQYLDVRGNQISDISILSVLQHLDRVYVSTNSQLCGSCDYDNDGVNNGAEFSAGSHPYNAVSHPTYLSGGDKFGVQLLNSEIIAESSPGYSVLDGQHIVWEDFDNDGDYDSAFYVHGGDEQWDTLSCSSDCWSWYSGPQEGKLAIYENENGSYTRIAMNGITDRPKGDITDMLSFDYDNDGDRDLLLILHSVYGAPSWSTNSLSQRDLVLYEAQSVNGHLQFTDVTAQVGLPNLDQQSKVIVLDSNRDGYTDLFVLSNGNSLLYHYDPVTAKFGDISASVQLPVETTTYGEFDTAMGMDVDNDGLVDVVRPHNYYAPGGEIVIYKNNGDGGFTRLVASVTGAVSVGWAGLARMTPVDFNHDGKMDLVMFESRMVATSPWIFDYAGGQVVFVRNDSTSTSLSFAVDRILSDPGDAYDFYHSGALADYDNNGYFDVITSGSSLTHFFRQQSAMHFVQDDSITGVRQGWSDKVPSFVDYNGDGALDLVLPSDLETDYFYTHLGSGNHFLKIQLNGSVSGASALGARVEVTANGVTQTQQQLLQMGQPHVLHFGLGAAAGAQVRVYWPNGQATTLDEMTVGSVDRTLVIRE